MPSELIEAEPARPDQAAPAAPSVPENTYSQYQVPVEGLLLSSAFVNARASEVLVDEGSVLEFNCKNLDQEIGLTTDNTHLAANMPDSRSDVLDST